MSVLTLSSIRHVFSRHAGVLDKAMHKIGLGQAPEHLIAVDDITLSLEPGEMLGIVGESGCGKSTLGRIAAQLLTATQGSVNYQGETISQMTPKAAKNARRNIQMVFQNPYSSLNPAMCVGDAIIEAPLAHGLISRKERSGYLQEMMTKVGLSGDIAKRHPHELSGGQRQRVGIARALAVAPDVIVFDEAVAALDVSVQAQILNLLIELKEQGGFSSLFISHDLNVVRFISDRIAILYLGQLVEIADKSTIFKNAHHPYTHALLNEMPQLGAAKRAFTPLKGDLPSPLNPPSGCYFHPRCPHATALCRNQAPTLRSVGPGHQSACHYDLARSTAIDSTTESPRS